MTDNQPKLSHGTAVPTADLVLVQDHDGSP